jgi:simple sugar transport system ATP-binding protein
MHEVMQSDRVSVLRKGRLVGTLATADATRAQLTRMTIGRDIDEPINRAGAPGEQTVLSLQDVTLRRRRGRPALEGVSFDLHEGEILGLAGIAGNGQSELLETIAGLRRPSSGEIRLAGKPTDDLSPRRIADLGLGHVPNDRLADGLAPALSIADNLILGQQWRRPYRRGVVLDGACIEARARDAIEQYDIAAPGHATPVRRLSGGNAQKDILAREFAKAKNCLLAHPPTRGLDVGVVDYVHGELLRLRADGVAILLVSEELEELFALADRNGVMFEGRLLDVFPREEADVQTIGQLMAGFREMVST